MDRLKYDTSDGFKSTARSVLNSVPIHRFYRHLCNTVDINYGLQADLEVDLNRREVVIEVNRCTYLYHLSSR